MAEPQRLCVRTTPRVFEADELDGLRAALDVLIRDTLTAEITAVSEVEFRNDGRVGDGYRFTQPALRQFCDLACPGLYRLIVEVSGGVRDPARPRDEYSFALAVQMFNRVVNLRPDRFIGTYRLLKDVRQKRIEGVLGPRYTLVDNAEVLDQACHAAESVSGTYRFRQAILDGRRLRARFVAPEPFVALAGPRGTPPDTFSAGLHVANGEGIGGGTARVAHLLRRDGDGSCSLGPYLGGRRVHVGRDLGARIGAAFAAAVEEEPIAAAVAARLGRLKASPLRLGGDREEHDLRVQKLVRTLKDAGVPAERGRAAIAAASLRGDGLSMPAQAAAAATAFDLYAALTRHARNLHALSAESIEQAAHGILWGRVRLG